MINITVFTPTYNRAHTLPQLYKSICEQSFTDFEWLIIDDGSTDGTEQLVAQWINENKVDIHYLKVRNGGKHRAINKGVPLAKGELFFIVDSDDCLLPFSLEWIWQEYQKIKDNQEFCGLAGSRATPQGHRIGGDFPYDYLDCNAIDFRLKYKIKGDLAEVFRTEILKNHPFPEIPNEKFCPEALVWNRIASKYKMRFFAKPIYVTEYLPDGLTAKITKLRHESPVASTIYYSEFSQLKIPLIQKLKGAINFWRFSTTASRKDIKKPNLPLSILAFPIGKLMCLRDK